MWIKWKEENTMTFFNLPLLDVGSLGYLFVQLRGNLLGAYMESH